MNIRPRIKALESKTKKPADAQLRFVFGKPGKKPKRPCFDYSPPDYDSGNEAQGEGDDDPQADNA